MTRRKPTTTTISEQELQKGHAAEWSAMTAPTDPDDQPHLAVPKTEGAPYHPDPDVMARLTELDATDPLPQPDPASATEAMIYAKHDRKQVDDLARRLAAAGMIIPPMQPFDVTTNPDDVDPPEWYAHPTPVKESELGGNIYDDIDDDIDAIRREDQEKWDGIEAAMNATDDDHAIEERLQFATGGTARNFVWTAPQDVTSWAEENGIPTDDHATNPYLLESSRILGDLANEANRATAVIHQLDAEMAHLTADADFQIARITARRDAELASRQARVDDLMKIVSANTIVNGAKDQSNE